MGTCKGIFTLLLLLRPDPCLYLSTAPRSLKDKGRFLILLLFACRGHPPPCSVIPTMWQRLRIGSLVIIANAGVGVLDAVWCKRRRRHIVWRTQTMWFYCYLRIWASKYSTRWKGKFDVRQWSSCGWNLMPASLYCLPRVTVLFKRYLHYYCGMARVAASINN